MTELARVCEHCGGPLPPKNKRFCGTRCQAAAKRKLLKPEQYLRVESMAAAGRSKASIAQELEISPSTFNKRLGEDHQLAAAFEVGEGKLSDRIQDELFAIVDNPKIHPAAKVTALIFLAKARCRWIDRPETIQSQDNRIQVAITLPKSLPSWEAFERAQKPRELVAVKSDGAFEVADE